MNDKQIKADRWRDQSDLDDNQHQNAEPDRQVIGWKAKLQPADHRPENRDGQQDHRQAVHQAAHDQVEHQHDDQHGHRRKGIACHKLGQFLRHLCQCKEATIEGGPQNNKENHRRLFARGNQALAQANPAQPSCNGGNPPRGQCANRRAVGGREPAAIDTANDQRKHQQHRPDICQSAQAFGPRQGCARTGAVWHPAHVDRNHHHVAKCRDDPRYHGSDEQFSDILLGQCGIDHQDHRRRDQDTQGAACRQGR